jgi:aldehyde:ferredoxin oxidoreductase
LLSLSNGLLIALQLFISISILKTRVFAWMFSAACRIKLIYCFGAFLWINEDLLMLAYAGKILYVDLSSGKARTEPLNDAAAKSYIGGLGLAINLLMDVSKPKKDAYDPDNPLIFCTGPLTGTLGPAGNGYVVVSKSPATGCVGEGKTQGYFGPEIKRAGYDAIIIKGKAEQLSYLWIDDDKVEIKNAQHLKGATPKEVDKKIRDELGDFSSASPPLERLERNFAGSPQ